MRGSSGEHSEAEGGKYDISNRCEEFLQMNIISELTLKIFLSDISLKSSKFGGHTIENSC